jgi:hypothetical protein
MPCYDTRWSLDLVDQVPLQVKAGTNRAWPSLLRPVVASEPQQGSTPS